MHEVEKLILDDINDVYFLLQEKVIWSGKPTRSNKDILLIYWTIGLTLLTGLVYMLIGDFNSNFYSLVDFGKDYYLLILLIFIILYIIIYDYRIKEKEQYWLLKNHFVLKGGYKDEFKVYRYTDLEMVQNEMFNGKLQGKEIVSIYFKNDIQHPFSYFDRRTKNLELGPIKEAKRVYELMLNGMHEKL